MPLTHWHQPGRQVRRRKVIRDINGVSCANRLSSNFIILVLFSIYLIFGFLKCLIMRYYPAQKGSAGTGHTADERANFPWSLLRIRSWANRKTIHVTMDVRQLVTATRHLPPNCTNVITSIGPSVQRSRFLNRNIRGGLLNKAHKANYASS